MEISEVKRRIQQTIEAAKRAAAERRGRVDRAARDYDAFLERIAVPIFRQVSNVLKSENRAFTVFTPAGSVRLMSDRFGDDFIELALDSTGAEPLVMGHTSRGRGRRVVESERVIGSGNPGELTEEDVLSFLAKELEPFVEKG
ncbi:MAG TPA: hypothetical protein VGJ29_17255 [Vicinamibacterales bacterium]|jgi:hypothetical protein